MEEMTKMTKMIRTFSQLRNDEAGQGLIEYIMMAALVITAAVACFPGLSTALSEAFSGIGVTLLKYVT
jgi:Flp pilus assembly pilin Flp